MSLETSGFPLCFVFDQHEISFLYKPYLATYAIANQHQKVHICFFSYAIIRGMGYRQPVDTKFPSRIRMLREEVFEWSKSETARRAKISPSLYGRYEHGTVEPTLSNILKLMDAFKVDFLTLIGKKPLNVVPSGETTFAEEADSH